MELSKPSKYVATLRAFLASYARVAGAPSTRHVRTYAWHFACVSRNGSRPTLFNHRPFNVFAALRPNVSTNNSCKQGSKWILFLRRVSLTENTIPSCNSPADKRSCWISRANSECSTPASSAIACHFATAAVQRASSSDSSHVCELGRGNIFLRGFH